VAVSDTAGYALTPTINQPANGTATFDGSGDWSYVPAAGFTGTDSFTYTVDDGSGNTATGTITIDVEAPVALGTSAATLPTESVAVPALDSDPPGNALGVSYTQGAHGAVTFDGTGTFTYAPSDPTYTGTDSFTETVNNGFGGTATATETIQIITQPVGTADSFSVIHDQQLYAPAGGVLANDLAPDGDTLTAALVGGPGHGTLTLGSDGGFLYTPSAGFVGTDTFTYAPTDGTVAGAPVTVTIAVTSDPPSAIDATVTTDAQAPVLGNVLSNVVDPDADPLTAALVRGPSDGALILNPDGSFTYTPNANFSGSDSFTYQASDGVGGTATGTVDLTVSPAPVAADLSASVQPGGAITYIPAWTDPSGSPVSVTSVTQGSHGTVTLGPGGLVYAAADPNYTGTDTFQYTISDGDGGTSTGAVTVNLTAVLTANDMTISIHAGGSATVYPIYFDMGGSPVTLTSYTQGQHGTVAPASAGMGLTYTANNPTYVGADLFTYTVSDGNGNTATGTVHINLTNQAPVGSDVTLSAPANAPVSVPITAYDPDGDALTVTTITQPPAGSGTVALNQGQLVYTPPSGFTGTVEFSYVVDDGHGGTCIIHVTINVTP
jgi:hypothetical protein